MPSRKSNIGTFSKKRNASKINEKTNVNLLILCSTIAIITTIGIYTKLWVTFPSLATTTVIEMVRFRPSAPGPSRPSLDAPI